MKRKLRYSIFSVLMLGTIPLSSVLSKISTSNFSHALLSETETIENPTKPTTLEDLKGKTPEQIASYNIFDGRTLGLTSEVKNQLQGQICWAYALAATAEANILMKKDQFPDLNITDPDKFNINQYNIDFAYNKRSGDMDPLKLTLQDKTDRGLNGVGISVLFYISQMFLQHNSPLQTSSDNEVNGLPPLYNGNRVGYTDTIISLPNDVDTIKKAIAQYGSVSFTYKHNGGTYKYYADDAFNPDHANAIVGWDDTISRFDLNNGKNSATPSRNGAWIVKNSWGPNHYETDDPANPKSGYFYLSYDSKIQATLNMVPNSTYDNVYYYDGKAEVSIEPAVSDSKKIASIFPVKKANAETKEELKAITFAAYGKNIKVKASVYENVNIDPKNINSTLNDPTSGNLVATKTTEVIANPGDKGGTYTIKLENPVELNPNSYYSIVLEPAEGSNNIRWLVSSEISDNDLSFFVQDDKWKNTAVKIDGGYKPVTTIKGLTKESKREESAPKNIGLAKVVLPQDTYTYGEQINPNPIVSYDNAPLELNRDYQLSYQEVVANEKSDPNIAGKVVITIKGINGYTGETKVYANLNKAPRMSDEKIQTIGTYNQETNTITIAREDNFNKPIERYKDINLENGWEFTVPNFYIAPGNSKIVYKGDDAGFYKNNEFNLDVKINHQQENINGITHNLIDEVIYRDYPWTPDIVLKYNNKQLNKDSDYSIEYENNIDAGNANIKVTGKKYFDGVMNIPFTIKKADNQIYSFNIENNHPVAYAQYGSDTIQYQYFKDLEGNMPLEGTPTTTGTYYVKAYVPETNNYNEVSSNIIPFNFEQTDTNKENSSNNQTLILAITIPVSLIVLALIIGLTIYFVKKRKVKKA